MCGMSHKSDIAIAKKFSTALVNFAYVYATKHYERQQLFRAVQKLSATLVDIKGQFYRLGV